MKISHGGTTVLPRQVGNSVHVIRAQVPASTSGGWGTSVGAPQWSWAQSGLGSHAGSQASQALSVPAFSFVFSCCRLWFPFVCGRLLSFAVVARQRSLRSFVFVCGRLRSFVFVCYRLWSCVLVCARLRSFAVVCARLHAATHVIW